MRRRSSAGGEPTKAQRRKTAGRKSRLAPKAVRPRSRSAAREGNKGRAAYSRADQALEQQTAITIENTRLLRRAA